MRTRMTTIGHLSDTWGTCMTTTGGQLGTCWTTIVMKLHQPTGWAWDMVNGKDAMSSQIRDIITHYITTPKDISRQHTIHYPNSKQQPKMLLHSFLEGFTMIPAVPTTPAILGAATAVWVVCRCLAIVIAYKEINGRKPQQKRSMLPWQLSVTDCFVWALRLELVYTFHLLISVPLQLLSIRLFWWMQRQLTAVSYTHLTLPTKRIV